MITVMLEKFRKARGEESAFTTAELLGNAALGIAALVVIWGLMGGLGQQVFSYIEGKILK